MGISETEVCPRCSQQAELLIHLLRDCNKSREVWEAFVPRTKRQRFMATNLNEWIKSNVEDTTRIGMCTDSDTDTD